MTRIVIIKLGALGDVVRTLSVLPAIKEKYQNPEIFWITKSNALQIFENNSYVEKVFATPYKINFKEKFDVLYNFDIGDEATKLALEIKAEKKFGFYSQEGFPASFNLAGEYYLNTLFDDDLKKNNKRTYQEMMFEIAELKWKKQPGLIFLNERNKKFAENFFKENNLISKDIIGIHMGASSRWPSKVWHSSQLIDFIIKAKKKGYEILLFAGPNEIKEHEKIIKELKSKKVSIYQNNPKNTIKEFASLVNLCKIIICSDSLALHLSLSLKKPTIGLFFCTSPDEVEDYNLLKKIVSPMLKDFFPEKMDKYNKKLVNSISADEVLLAVNSIK